MIRDSLKKRVGFVDLPVIVAPMFLVSSPEMVIECCKSGTIGSIPLLNARSSTILDDWMRNISEELAKFREIKSIEHIVPWAVNLIIHKSNKRFDEDVALIRKYQPPIVITSLGDPTLVTKIVHEYNGLVFSDVTTLYHAKKAVEKGVDGLILICNGAGGHGGNLNPFVFINSVKEFWDGIIVLGGTISKGRDILAAKILGADFVYMGTRFIATSESLASKEYKDMLVQSTLEDLINTDAFTGVNANFLIPSIIDAGLDPKNLSHKQSLDFSDHNLSEPRTWKDIWSAGQGIGMVKDNLTVSSLINELKKEYADAINSILKNT